MRRELKDGMSDCGFEGCDICYEDSNSTTGFNLPDEKELQTLEVDLPSFNTSASSVTGVDEKSFSELGFKIKNLLMDMEESNAIDKLKKETASVDKFIEKLYEDFDLKEYVIRNLKVTGESDPIFSVKLDNEHSEGILRFVPVKSSVLGAAAFNQKGDLTGLFLAFKKKDSDKEEIVCVYHYPDATAEDFALIFQSKSIGAYLNTELLKKKLNYTRRYDVEDAFNEQYQKADGFDDFLRSVGLDTEDFSDQNINRLLTAMVGSLIRGVEGYRCGELKTIGNVSVTIESEEKSALSGKNPFQKKDEYLSDFSRENSEEVYEGTPAENEDLYAIER